MRAPFACFLAILLLAVGVLAWDKDDYEIFDLVRDLKADGGECWSLSGRFGDFGDEQP